MALFLVIALTIWGVLHAYVFWRLGSVPWIAAHLSGRWLALLAVVLWGAYPATHWIGARLPRSVGWALEFTAANWFGVLFLLFCTLLVVDVVTLGGWVLPRLAVGLRGWAVVAAAVLSLLALVQGLRAPVVTRHEISLTGLPPERDGLTLVAVSDLHLGSLLGERWLAARIAQIDALHPDLVVLVGDVVDHYPERVEPMCPTLRRLRAPLGVWAVTGNHEHYGGVDRCAALFDTAGFRLLRDRTAAVVPGLVLAGVDDLSARRRNGSPAVVVANTLARRPAGATLLLSHSPLAVEAAARAGVGLMISGHTHNGQIWPFSHLVGLQYPHVAGRYEIGAMTLLVGRGTGTWGPRMRLWRPGEILCLRLRAPAQP